MYDFSRLGSLCFINWLVIIKIKIGMNIRINECYICKKKNMYVYYKNLILSFKKFLNNNGLY